jgi:hypothetical protein
VEDQPRSKNRGTSAAVQAEETEDERREGTRTTHLLPHLKEPDETEMMVGVHVGDEDELDVPHDVDELLAAEEADELTVSAFATV